MARVQILTSDVLRACLAADTLARALHRARAHWIRSVWVGEIAERIYEARRAAWGDEPQPWSALTIDDRAELVRAAKRALASREWGAEWDALTVERRRQYRQWAEDMVCQGRRLPRGMSPCDFFHGRRVVTTGLHRPDRVIGAIEPE